MESGSRTEVMRVKERKKKGKEEEEEEPTVWHTTRIGPPFGKGDSESCCFYRRELVEGEKETEMCEYGIMLKCVKEKKKKKEKRGGCLQNGKRWLRD